jgi:formylglycine-generating enzyme required for sulfatase activity
MGEVICDGTPIDVLAELQPGANDPQAAHSTPHATFGGANKTIGVHPIGASTDLGRTVQQSYTPSRFDVQIDTAIPKRKSKGLILGIAGALALLLIVIAGVTIAFMSGLFTTATDPGNRTAATPTPAVSPTVTTVSKQIEMVAIPGGTFMMGRNDRPAEFPEHTVQVSNFLISKTEVTNAQYLEFVNAKGHVPPKHWVEGVPIRGTESEPVGFVSLDDAIAFTKWKSQVDGGTFRLPTEQEWEYVARNGSKQNLYPWGDTWIEGNAVMGRSDSELSPVGSKPQGANTWGVLDLIGNVYEWTSSQYYRYPGSEERVAAPDKQKEAALKSQFAIRGGSVDIDRAKIDITSTFRAFAARETKNKVLGFRIVKEG